MSIMITKSKNVPRRLYGFGDSDDDDSNFVDMEAEPTSTFTPTVPTDVSAPYPSFLPPELDTSQPIAIVKTVVKRATTPYVVVPFLAYAALTDKLPVWARLVSALIGAGVMMHFFDAGGSVTTSTDGLTPCQPYGLSYGRSYGEIAFKGGRGLGCGADCGCRSCSSH